MDDFEGFAVDTPNVTTEVVDMARELELEVAPEDVTELLNEPLTDEDLLLLDEQRKLFLEAESAVDDDDDNEIKEMSTKDLEHYVGLLHTVVKGFESIDNNFERSKRIRFVEGSDDEPHLSRSTSFNDINKVFIAKI